MEQYNVTGMSCAACSARVEKAVSAVPGVTSCSVSLLTNSMGVEGTASSETIIRAVTDAGYGASLKGASGVDRDKSPSGDSLTDKESPLILKRLIASLIFLLPLMYVSMGHMMWGWPVPSFINNHVALGLFQLLFAAIVMVINQKFFINGFRGLMHRAPNMDTLVALGSMASFAYSTVMLFKLTGAEAATHQSIMHDFYFESAAMILTLITVGKLLESLSKGRTTDALKGLMKLAPATAVIEKNGAEITVPIEQVKVGDIFILRPGDSIPVDGEVIEGQGAIDESALTGESLPVEVTAGDVLYTSCINTNGFLKCHATRVGEDTSLSKIIQLVSDAAATKAPIAKLADKVSGVFVPGVICIALITLAVWLFAGQSFGYALARAVSVLVISCPCALGLATPVAIMVGNGVGAKNGILFKTAVSLEETGNINIVALDKTGTITKGTPSVTGIFPAEGVDADELLLTAYLLECKSEHPLAKAVVEKYNSIGSVKEGEPGGRDNCPQAPADSRNSTGANKLIHEVRDFRIFPGNGLSGIIGATPVYGGNEGFIRKYAEIPDMLKQKALELSGLGETPLFFANETKVLGIISVSDIIREDSAQAIAEMKALGLHVVMLTGDNYRTALAIGKKAGVDEVIAGVKPDDKAAVITRLKEFGKVAMIGDGINDAPALTVADMGIAIKSGTDIAIDAADIVLMKNSLRDAAAAIRLSRKTLLNIKENLFWAFFYNIIGIPLAAGLWIPIFGLTLNPMFGAAAMSLSSFCVVTNALRLNLIKIYDSTKDKPVKNAVGHEPLLENTHNQEDKEMIIKVEGMMCHHCEMHVEKALTKVAGIESAKADHETGTVTLEMSGIVKESDIKAAIEEAGYKYLGMQG